MTIFAARSKLRSAEEEIKSLETEIRRLRRIMRDTWACLNQNDDVELSLKLLDEALNGPRP